MSDQVCIPCYNRAELCNEKTLNMLRAHNIPKGNLYVYVASQEECDRHKETLDANLFGKLVIRVKGLIQQRQYIMEQRPESKDIVLIDDDAASIDLSTSDVFKKQTLDYFFQEAFEEIRKRRS